MFKRILLAEDDRASAQRVKSQLEHFGYDVITVGDGRQALDIILSEPVDLLITDVVMPEMDGVDLYLALKQNERTAHLPVIIITDKQMFKDSFSTLGVDHFVPKASDIKMLLKKIHDIEKAGGVQAECNEYRKILIGGIDTSVVSRMQGLLQKYQCLVSVSDNSMDLASKVFSVTPHVILLDVRMRDNASPSELVRSFRALNSFQNTRIIIYSSMLTGQGALDPADISIIEEEVAACICAGANKYIGHFSAVTFIDILQKMDILSFGKEFVPSS